MNDQTGWIQPTEATMPFFEGAKQGVLRLQSCDDCSMWMYPIKKRCQACGSNELSWKDASGKGAVYAHARLHRQYHARHKDKLPIVIAWVDLEEGVRVPGNIVHSDAETIKAGMPVE
ncbi:MAG TPA: hypothetical protein EYG51_23160, partial [Pseudomonadales bacterium]|nr:hypothetical protein [Pseudomonadales bacterium]